MLDNTRQQISYHLCFNSKTIEWIITVILLAFVCYKIKALG